MISARSPQATLQFVDDDGVPLSVVGLRRLYAFQRLAPPFRIGLGLSPAGELQ